MIAAAAGASPAADSGHVIHRVSAWRPFAILFLRARRGWSGSGAGSAGAYLMGSAGCGAVPLVPDRHRMARRRHPRRRRQPLHPRNRTNGPIPKSRRPRQQLTGRVSEPRWWAVVARRLRAGPGPDDRAPAAYKSSSHTPQRVVRYATAAVATSSTTVVSLLTSPVIGLRRKTR
jgi:hypothetical protein